MHHERFTVLVLFMQVSEHYVIKSIILKSVL